VRSPSTLGASGCLNGVVGSGRLPGVVLGLLFFAYKGLPGQCSAAHRAIWLRSSLGGPVQ